MTAMADKTKKRNDGSVDLTKAYRTAAEKLITSLKGNDAQGIKVRFTKTLQAVKIELDTLNAREVEQAITEGAEQSLIKFNKTLLKIFNGRAFTIKDLTAAGLDIKNQKAAEAVLERRAADVKKSAVYRENFLELRGQLAGVCNALQAEVNGTLHKLAGKDANTVSAAIDELRERLKESGCLNVRYSNGASVGVDGYANMVCRSSRTESANVENLKAAETFGTDLVECVGNAVTCQVCAQFRDRVFSVSGKDKRYPPLRGGVNSPLREGYDLIHPNCRCEFRAYFEALHTPEENEAKRKFSNRPFEGDKRTDAQRRAYQEWQTVQRRAIDERYRYNEMREVLGADMQYADLPSLRRALRSDKESFAYKKSHYAVRDFRQYERWKEIIGKENLPESLADFQELKYNKSEVFERLKNFKNYKVDNPKATQVDYKKVIRLKENGVKGDIHIPPIAIDNVEKLEFDDYHINIEREHNVTREEAISFIKNAKVTVAKWKGQSLNYYSKAGAVYVLNGKIRTAFVAEQFDDVSKTIMEVLNDE